MAKTTKLVFGIIFLVFALGFLALLIYFAVQTALLKSKLNKIWELGTGGTEIFPGAQDNLTITGSIDPLEAIVWRWDHKKSSDANEKYQDLTASLRGFESTVNSTSFRLYISIREEEPTYQEIKQVPTKPPL